MASATLRKHLLAVVAAVSLSASLGACGGGNGVSTNGELSQVEQDSKAAEQPTANPTSVDTAFAEGIWTLDECTTAAACHGQAYVNKFSGVDGSWLLQVFRSSATEGVQSYDVAQVVSHVLVNGAWAPTVSAGHYTRTAPGTYQWSSSEAGVLSGTTSMREEAVGGASFQSVGFPETGSFPEGAKIYRSTHIQAFDQYLLFASTDFNALNEDLPEGTTYTSLASFVSAHQSNSTQAARRPLLSGELSYQFTFDGELASTGTVSFWSHGSVVAQGTYEVRSLDGLSVLVISGVPSTVVSGIFERSVFELGRRQVFSVANGHVHEGAVIPAGTEQDDTPSLNLTALNALLKARGLCAINASGVEIQCR